MMVIPAFTVTAAALFTSIMMSATVMAEKYAIEYNEKIVEETFLKLYTSTNDVNQQTPININTDTTERWSSLCSQIRHQLQEDSQRISPSQRTRQGEIPPPLPNIPQHPRNPRQPPPSHPQDQPVSTETYSKHIIFRNIKTTIEKKMTVKYCKSIDLQDPEFYIMNLPVNSNIYFILSYAEPRSEFLYFYAYVDTDPDETGKNRHV